MQIQFLMELIGVTTVAAVMIYFDQDVAQTYRFFHVFYLIRIAIAMESTMKTLRGRGKGQPYDAP